MNSYLSVLRKCVLFKEQSDAQILQMLRQIDAIFVQSSANQVIIEEDSPAEQFGIVLEGQVQVVQYDFSGNRNIFATLNPGELFAESFAFSDLKKMSVEVCSSINGSRVLLIQTSNLYHNIFNREELQAFLENMLNAMANKNILFDERMEIISKRRTRDKLLTYLRINAKHKNSDTIICNYSRQELADYLGVDRSGLCTEIGKLQREGAIYCHNNSFTLL